MTDICEQAAMAATVAEATASSKASRLLLSVAENQPDQSLPRQAVEATAAVDRAAEVSHGPHSQDEPR